MNGILNRELNKAAGKNSSETLTGERKYYKENDNARYI